MAYPQELGLDQLIESKLNPRKVFIESEVAEIAESAAADAGGRPRGILEPLIVRPRHDTKRDAYEIIAGAKRFRAAKLASLSTVPVRVMEMSDQQVLEAMLIENLQRSDPHALEEAEGYRKLLAMDKSYTADTIAVKVGKDRSYVYKRLQLTHLIEPLKGKFLEGKINIGHALQLCRLQESDQIAAGKEGLFYGSDREVVSVERLREWIERNVFLQLSGAPWDKADATLVPAAGPCTTCPKRTGANTLLFDDVGAKQDRCLDRKCFQAKQAALVQLSIAKAGEKGVDLVKVAKGWQERQKKHAAGILIDGQYQEAVKSKCAKPESAIIVAGEDVGKKFQICRTRGCKQHGYSSPHRAPSRTAADIWKEKERHLNREIQNQADQRVALAIIQSVETLGMHEYRAIARELLDGLGDDDTTFLAKAVGIEVKLPEKKRQVYGHAAAYKAVHDHIGVCPPKTLARITVGSIILTGSVSGKDRDGFEKPYKVDRKAIVKRVGVELRTKFKAEKALAAAKAKKPKKPAPAAKAKAAAK